MTDELFQPNAIPETPSPRILWMRRHGVVTSSTEDGTWVASVQGKTKFAQGATELEAIQNLAVTHNLPLWRMP